ncbi:MAG: ATP-binding protein [Pseudomonadota bacterium]|nr:ATP-binding protein [Pseudomonadota bacterium]
MINILINNLKKTFIPFIFLFCFSSAIGIFYSIHNTADSNPKTISIFLFFGILSFLLLLFLILFELSRLIFNIKKNRAASRLHSKIVGVFATIAIIPVVIVAILAVIFFEKGIEAWFSKRVQIALEKSATIAENYAVEVKKKVEGDSLYIALKLSNYNSSSFSNRLQLNYILNELSIERNANELAVIDNNGTIIAASRNSFFVPSNISPRNIFSNRKDKGSPLVFINDNTNNNISVITPLIGHFGLYLYFSRYLDPEIILNLKSVKESVNDYSQARKNSEESRITFTMVFLLVALILLLLAIWLGIAFANSLTAPISSLISASESVSSGNLKVSIYNNNNNKKDEIGSLIDSFNRMVKQLYDQRKDLITANEQIDTRRRFTESVLTGVKSGVLGVDSNNKIFLVNKSSLELLEYDASKLIGRSIFDLFPNLKKTIQNITELNLPVSEEQLDYIYKGKKKKFIIRISFENYKSLNSGYVVTIENITELIKIQRAAAWADIAKRIAHEIKNPLTPIQLSADRLKHKYLNKITNEKSIFINCIDTIIRQVSTIHRMVNEFSTFAEMPRPIFQKVNINEIIIGSISMIKLANSQLSIKSNLEKIEKIYLKADPNLINQALNNLFKNSINAINENKEIKVGEINIELYKKNNLCYLDFIDNGVGFPVNKEHLLEPYISRSKKGSGLGLAVVKKIMEDHKGSIELKDNIKNGAKVILSFPLSKKLGAYE